ncbi:MAG TPA: carboxylesterase family protein, partial [Agromyces sp.]
MFRLPTSIAAVTLLVAVVAAPSEAVEAAPIAETRYGLVGGTVDEGIVQWRAIPYAAPPVGDLRWRPPSPPEPWNGVRLEADFAPQCLQLGIEAPVEGSEDCLYLNVFAPAGTAPAADLPVMVHLHGGRNFFGRAYRDASAFVERGVMVVTVGYRLGVFGFVGHPELSAENAGSSGEYGVLDQLA